MMTRSIAAVVARRGKKASKGKKSAVNFDDDSVDGYPDLPTEYEFQISYNDEIQDAKSCNRRLQASADDLVAIDSVTKVAEMQRVDCQGPRRKLATIIDVTFESDTNQPPNASQLQILGQVFVETYRDLTFLNPKACDPYFRTVVSRP
jgi:hypothetical protein